MISTLKKIFGLLNSTTQNVEESQQEQNSPWNPEIEVLRDRAVVVSTERKKWGISEKFIESPVLRVELATAFGGYTSMHRHPNTSQVVYVVDGIVDIISLDPDGSENHFRLDSNYPEARTAYITSGTWHRLVYPDYAVFMEICQSDEKGYSIERKDEGSPEPYQP